MQCCQFPASIAKDVIVTFKGTRVLDFSTGWGGRLLGAIAADVELYHGFDPNSALQEGHDEIISSLVPVEIRSNFSIRYEPFETATVASQEYDLVFTSPPFFDFELYSEEAGQSILSYPDLEDWVVRFLFASVKKAWEVLEEDGHFVIHLQDGESVLCERLCLFFLAYLPGAQHVGVIGWRGADGQTSPLWVFQKMKGKGGSATQTKAKKYLQEYYPETAALLLKVKETSQERGGKRPREDGEDDTHPAKKKANSSKVSSNSNP